MRLSRVTTGILFLVLAAAGCGSSGTSNNPDTGGGMDTPTSAAVTYDGDIKAIFAAKCTPCHTTGGSASIFHTMASSYADVNKDASVCPGKKKGECAAVRVHNGQMPAGKGCKGDPTMDSGNAGCLTAAELTKLDAWVAGGLKEK